MFYFVVPRASETVSPPWFAAVEEITQKPAPNEAKALNPAL
jgi:hypothetical protein